MPYIGQGLTEGRRRAYNFVATSNQTTFSATYDAGYVDVYQNGILLSTTDYTATNGTTVVLGVGASASDEITIIAHQIFSVTDTVSATQGGTFDSAIDVTGNITTTGSLRGPSSFTIDPATHGDNTGTVVIAGDLTVNGTTTTINSTTLTVDDKNIILASGTSNSSTADGSGLTIDLGSDGTATMVYTHATTSIDFNKDIRSPGATFTDDATFTGDSYNAVWDKSANSLKFSDNAEARFGTGEDLRIFHDGTNNIIRGMTRPTWIQTDNTIFLTKNAASETMAKFIGDGAVELYHNNVKKFETTSTGATVTGTLVADGMSVGDNEFISVGASGDFTISHDGNNSRIKDVGTGSLLIEGSFISLSKAGGSEPMAKFFNDGAVELYHDNSKKIETTSTGVTVSGNILTTNIYGANDDNTGIQFEGSDVLTLHTGGAEAITINSSQQVGIGVASPTRKLELNNGGTGNLVTFTDGVATNFTFKTDGNSVGTFGTEAGSTKLAFMVASSEKVRIDGSGNVGIGTNNPGYKLQVNGSVDILNLKGSAGNAFVRFTDSDATADFSIGADDNSGAGAGAFILYDRSNSAYRLAVNSSGKVGIGTTNPIQFLEVSAGAPTIGLNSPGQATNQKIVRIAASQFTGGDFSVQQMNDNGTGIHRTPFLINNAGNVGIGVTSPDSLLHLQKTRSGSISGGSSDTGAVLKLHTEAQWESGYGNNAGTSTNDFLGSVEFSTGDSSTGEGVRAAIRATVDSYYNTNSLRFYTAPSNTVGVINRFNIAANGNIGIGASQNALSPGSQIVIAKNHSTYNSGDNNKRIDFQANGTSSRNESRRIFHYAYAPGYNSSSWHRILLGDGSYASGHTIKYSVLWTTGHAAGHAYDEGVVSMRSHHSSQNLSLEASSGTGAAHVRKVWQYGGGSYYGWSSTPHVRFHKSSSTGTNAEIWMRVYGHNAHNGNTYDGATVHTIHVELLGNDYVTSRKMEFVAHSTPSSAGSEIGLHSLG